MATVLRRITNQGVFNFFFPWGATTACAAANLTTDRRRRPPTEDQQQQQQTEQLPEPLGTEQPPEPFIDYSNFIANWPEERREPAAAALEDDDACRSGMDAVSQVAQLDYLERHLTLVTDLLHEASRAKPAASPLARPDGLSSSPLMAVPVAVPAAPSCSAAPEQRPQLPQRTQLPPLLLSSSSTEDTLLKGFDLRSGKWK